MIFIMLMFIILNDNIHFLFNFGRKKYQIIIISHSYYFLKKIYKFIFTFFYYLEILCYLLFKFWYKYIENKFFLKTIIDEF